MGGGEMTYVIFLRGLQPFLMRGLQVEPAPAAPVGQTNAIRRLMATIPTQQTRENIAENLAAAGVESRGQWRAFLYAVM